MTASLPIVPVYRALTIAGTVLVKDEMGEMHHAVVVDSTAPENVVVVYSTTVAQ